MQDSAGEAEMNSCDILQWTPSHGRAKAGRPARTYMQQLCADTGWSFEDLPEAMDDREGRRERVRYSLLITRHDDNDDDNRLYYKIRFILIFKSKEKQNKKKIRHKKVKTKKQKQKNKIRKK